MKHFNTIIIGNGDEELLGSGRYQKADGGIAIQSNDSSITSFFEKAIRSKKRIGAITFKFGNSERMYAGEFIVLNVSGDMIGLEKVS